MRIALFGTISGLGGIEQHTRMLATALLDAGVEVMVISSLMNATALQSRQLVENEPLCRGGIEILWVPERPNILKRLLEVPLIVRSVRNYCPDILLGTQTSYHLGLLGIFLPRSVRKIFFEVMSGESYGLKDPRWLIKWTFDEVVGQSPRVARNFTNSFGWKKKVSAIPAFPQPLEITAKLPEVRQRAVILGTARAALFSRLVEGKQALWLARHWELLKDLIGVLHFHGCGPEQSAIEAFIDEHGLQDRVCCFGAYPSGQAYADLLASYELTLLPTIFPEGAPLVLLESMACGIPFVANGVGGIPDYATDNPDCIVVSEQSAFLDGVRRMVSSLSKGDIDQSRLKRHYLNKYSHAAIKKKWFECLGVSKA